MRELSLPEFAVFMCANVGSIGGTALLWLFLDQDGLRDLNPILVSLATLQVFLIVVAICGYWMIRSAAERQASQEVREMMPSLVANLVNEHMQSMLPQLRRDIRNFRDPSERDGDDMQDVIDSLE